MIKKIRRLCKKIKMKKKKKLQIKEEGETSM